MIALAAGVAPGAWASSAASAVVAVAVAVAAAVAAVSSATAFDAVEAAPGVFCCTARRRSQESLDGMCTV